MPPASPKSLMSLGELVVCEDFLDGHREYALDLLSNLENVSQWHRTDNCPKSRESRTCTLCELCSVDGLMGATKKALEIYDDAEKRLKTARGSLGKGTSSRGPAAPGGETLFRNSLAKAVFFSIVTAGDSLQSQHATWQTRLQTELATPSSSAQGSHHGLGDLDWNRIGDILLPNYSGPKVVGSEMNPKLTAASTGPVSSTTSSSSMFVVFRRCLSPDCPCELNRANVAANAKSRGARGSQVAPKVVPSPMDSEKTQTSKRPRKSNDSSNALARAKTNAQKQEPSTRHDSNSPDPRAPDTPRPQDTVLEAGAPSSSTPKTALWTQETKSPLPDCDALIIDPRLFRLRVAIARSDDARRALMTWCRACMADLQLDPREGNGIGPESSLTHQPTVKDTLGYPFALALDVKAVEPGKSLCATGHVGAATTKGLSHGDDETAAQELRFDEQEELERRWLTARQKRRKDQNRRSSGPDLH